MLVDIKRDIEKGIKYELKFIDNDKFGMINLDSSGNLTDDESEFFKIKHIDDLIISDENIKIYYPAYEIYYVNEYSSKKGFTLKKLLQLINKMGYNFHYSDYLQNPTYYNINGCEDAADSVEEYSVSYFYIDNSNIYVEVDH